MENSNKNEKKPSLTAEELNSIQPEEHDTVEKLTEKKLRGEVLVLKEQLNELVNKKKPDKSFKGWLEKRKSLFVAIAGFFATFFALFQPITEYLNNMGKHEQAKFNLEMISLIKAMSDTSETVQDRNLFVLKSYDPEAVIPFLLDEVDREPVDEIREKNKDISTDKIKEAIVEMWVKIRNPKGWHRFTNMITFTKSKKEHVGNIIFQYATGSFAELFNFSQKDASVKERIRCRINFYLKLAGDIGLHTVVDQTDKELTNLKARIDSTLTSEEDASIKADFDSFIPYAKGEQ